MHKAYAVFPTWESFLPILLRMPDAVSVTSPVILSAPAKIASQAWRQIMLYLQLENAAWTQVR